MEEAADMLYMLTSFSIYDTLAGPRRSPEQVAALIRRLAHRVLA
jgi:hypothetical protein